MLRWNKSCLFHLTSAPPLSSVRPGTGARHATGEATPPARAHAVLVALLLAAVLPRSALGTTFVLMDEATLLRTSDLALTATITAIETGAAPGPDSAIYSYIHLQPARLIKGAVEPGGELVLREPGGRFGNRQEWIYGAPEFWVGERALLFLERAADGTLHTNSLSLGKFTLGVAATGYATAVRDFGHGAAVLNPATGQLLATTPQAQRLLPLVKRLRHLARAEPRRRHTPRMRPLVPAELTTITTEVQDAYTFLGSPARWFEPDCGLPVTYLVDGTGDPQFGSTGSRAAADAALAAWTNVPGTGLVIQDGGLTTPSAFAGCGTNRVVFNDPFNEITDPTNCGGILAMGGFCTSGGNPCNPPSSSVVNGTMFNRIVTGKVTVNNGWDGCGAWTQCSMAEVLTHEIGHTIGFGHSADSTATMAAIAHFDGRCASLKSDDVAAITFAYPLIATRSPTRTTTPTPLPTVTPTAIHSRTPTTTPTLTPTLTFTPSGTQTSTPTPTATATATAPPSFTSTQTPTVTPTLPFTLAPTSPPTSTPSPVSFDVTGQVRYYSNAQPVSGVTVDVFSDLPASAQSDIGGQYLLPNVNGGMQIVPRKLGDDGAGISALDAAYILQALGGQRTLTSAQLLACDVTGNGTLSALDASLILQYKVGLISSFPVAQACGSDWAFIPTPALSANQALVNPTMSSGNCQPGAITFQPPFSTAPVNQDFAAVLFGDCTGNWQPSSLQAPLQVMTASDDGTEMRLGAARRVRQQLRMPISVQGAGVLYAFDGVIEYDAAHLRLLGVHRAPGAGGALVVVKNKAPGTIALAVASSRPLPHATVVSLHFAVKPRHSRHPAVKIPRRSVARADQ